jgi:hypothetical protein
MQHGMKHTFHIAFLNFETIFVFCGKQVQPLLKQQHLTHLHAAYQRIAVTKTIKNEKKQRNFE